jgi:hypothetical protein
MGDQQPDHVLTLVAVLDALLREVKRIADHFNPPPPNVIDSNYVARRMGRTPTRIAQMAREGLIPASCVVPGRSDGEAWRFYRDRVEEWLDGR